MIVRLTDVEERLKVASAYAETMMDRPTIDLNCIDYVDEVFDDVFRPTEGANPMSKWTKKAILNASKNAGIAQSDMETLELMSLDDLRGLFLKRDGVFLCGSGSKQGNCRHTIYYVLDLDFLRSFFDGESGRN